MNQNNFKVPGTEIPIVEDVDVVVCGGGPGGLAAAISAARNGAKTLLLEQYGCLGGMATVGLVGPFMHTAGANGGIFKELLGRIEVLRGASGYSFDPEIFKYVALQMVEEAGVKQLLHTFVEDVIIDKNNGVEGVFVANKAGRQAIKAKITIDATGDGDVSAFAGAEFEKGRPEDGKMQAASLFFHVGGVDVSKACKDISFLEKATRKAREAGEINLPEYVSFVPLGNQGSTIRKDEVSVNVDTITGIDGTDPNDLTLAENESRKRVLECIRFYHKYVPGYKNCFLINTAPLVGIRETRRVLGEYVLIKNDVLGAHKFDDGIAKASFFLDLHDGIKFSENKTQLEKELAPIRVPKGDWYEIPYGCLVPRKVDNLLTCGRCISSDREANGSLRIMPTCMATGQAAGTSAAMCLKSRTKPRELDGKAVRKKLFEQGVDIG